MRPLALKCCTQECQPWDFPNSFLPVAIYNGNFRRWLPRVRAHEGRGLGLPDILPKSHRHRRPSSTTRFDITPQANARVSLNQQMQQLSPRDVADASMNEPEDEQGRETASED